MAVVVKYIKLSECSSLCLAKTLEAINGKIIYQDLTANNEYIIIYFEQARAYPRYRIKILPKDATTKQINNLLKRINGPVIYHSYTKLGQYVVIHYKHKKDR